MPLELINPPTVIRRRPVLDVLIDGSRIPNVLECSSTRGLDQDVATARVLMPNGLRANVLKYSQIELYQGASNATANSPSFVGYVVAFETSLYPGAMTLVCEDPLTLARGFYTPNDIDQHNKNDITAIEQVLTTVGFDIAQLDIQGVGKKLGKSAENDLLWEQRQDALSRIQDIDAIGLGYKTYSLTSGRIARRFIPLIPTINYVHHFQEGVDILDGSTTMTRIDPSNQILVEGDGVKSKKNKTNDKQQWRTSPYWTKLKLLRVELTDADYFSTEEVAAFLAEKLGKWLIKVSFATHIDTFFQTGESVKITSDRLELDGQVFWVQSVTRHTSPDSGEFTQTFTCVSELMRRGAQRPLGGTPLPPPPVTTPGATVILPDFVIGPVIAELVIISGVETVLYDIGCSDVSTSTGGLIVSQAWTVTGAGAYPTSGTGKFFTTAVTDLDAVSITLEVADSNAITGTVTRPLTGLASSVRFRTLYTAATADFEALARTTWHTDQPSSGDVTGVAPGPFAHTNTDPSIVMYTGNNLVTSAAESEPFADQAATSLFVEVDVDARRVAAGGALGAIAVSSDLGTTWRLLNAPSADPILRVYMSRFNPNEFHVLTISDYFVSTTGGSTWATRISAAMGETFNDLVLSHTRNIICSTDGVRNVGGGVLGALFTGITAGRNIIAGQPDIKLDNFYVLDDTGDTWIQDTDGATVFIAGEPLPAGTTPEPRSMWREGVVKDVVYVAVGGYGVIKTVDGFKTPGGYFDVRLAGQFGAGSGPWLQVAGGELLAEATAAAIYVFDSSSNLLWTYDGATLTAVTYQPSAQDINQIKVNGYADADGNVYVGSLNTFELESSPDGVTWTTNPYTGLGSIVDIPNNLMRGDTEWAFIIASDSFGTGGIYTSPDGVAWTALAAAAPIPGGELIRLYVGSGSKYYALYDDGANTVIRDETGATITTPWSTGVSVPTGDGNRNISGALTGTTALMTVVHGGTYHLLQIAGGVATEVTPGGFASSFRFRAWSPDGMLWVGVTTPDVIGGTLFDQMWRSTDGGATWTEVTAGWGNAASNPQLSFDPTDTSIWYQAGTGAAGDSYKSTDGGVTWSSEAPLAGLGLTTIFPLGPTE